MNSTVPSSAAKKRPKPPGGSRKGRPNKVTADLKTMILGALDKVGGMDYLARQAEENPGAFLTLIGKVLPTTLAAGSGGSGFTLIVHDKPPA
jgi:hypothetical protein